MKAQRYLRTNCTAEVLKRHVADVDGHIAA
jgi:hypothetical protein